MYLEEKEIKDILKSHYIGQLTYIHEMHPAIVPMTFFYHKEGNCLIGYSSEGEKIEAMRVNPLVSLGVTEIHSMKNWKSVVVKGIYEELKGLDAKHHLHLFTRGIQSIIEEEGGDAQFIKDFSCRISDENMPVVFRVGIKKLTGLSKST